MPVISQLDTHFSPEEQGKLARFLVTNPRLTVEGFRSLLAEKGLEVGRSTAHDYQKRIEALGERTRKSRTIAESLVRQLGDAAIEGQYGRALVEMARTLAFDFLEKILDGRGEELTPQEFAFLGKALKEMAQAARLDQDFEIKVEDIRKQARKEALAAAASQLDGALKSAEANGESGLSAERVAQLRRDFLGVKPPTIDGSATEVV